MNKIIILRVLSLIFSALTICGAVYVISTGGKANPGFAVVPMIFSLALASFVRNSKKNHNAAEEAVSILERYHKRRFV